MEARAHRDGDNFAEFWIGNLPDFDRDGELAMGTESQNRKRWGGRIQRTADYYIYVMAWPKAAYNLRVAVKWEFDPVTPYTNWCG